MRAHIKSLHSPDTLDLASYVPEVADDFSVLVQLMVAPAGSDGAESFDVEVVTPARLMKRVAEHGPRSGRHMLIVSGFDYPTIRRWFERQVARCEGEDWDAVAAQLGRIGLWEFEDYQSRGAGTES